MESCWLRCQWQLLVEGQLVTRNIGITVLCLNPSGCMWQVSCDILRSTCKLTCPCLHWCFSSLCISNMGRIHFEPEQRQSLACLLKVCHVAWRVIWTRTSSWLYWSGASRVELSCHITAEDPGPALEWQLCPSVGPLGPESDTFHSAAGGCRILSAKAKETQNTYMPVNHSKGENI